MNRDEFDCWNEFRKSEEARYVGLTCPKFLLRMPYSRTHSESFFPYNEDVYNNHQQYLWGSSSFIFAANLAQTYKIRISSSKTYQAHFINKINRLSFQHHYFGDSIFPEAHEIVNLGFIPISCNKNGGVNFCLSEYSTHNPKVCKDSQTVDDLRIKTRLSYIFISSRIAHYLKILQREIISINVNRDGLEAELNSWLSALKEKFSHPNSSHSLKGCRIEVQSFDKSTGFFRILFWLGNSLVMCDY